MGSVSSSSALHGSVHSSMGYAAFLSINTLGLGVSAQVLQQLVNQLNRLLGPSSLSSITELLGLWGSANVAGVLEERNHSLVLENIFQVLNCFFKFHSLDGSGDVVGVLVVNSGVIDSAFGR